MYQYIKIGYGLFRSLFCPFALYNHRIIGRQVADATDKSSSNK